MTQPYSHAAYARACVDRHVIHSTNTVDVFTLRVASAICLLPCYIKLLHGGAVWAGPPCGKGGGGGKPPGDGDKINV